MTKKNVCMFIDASALKDVIEGKNKLHSEDFLKKIKEMHEVEYSGFHLVTSVANLQRAIYLSDPKSNINNLQKIIDCMEIYPSLANFRNKDDVINETIRIAGILLGGKKGDGKKEVRGV